MADTGGAVEIPRQGNPAPIVRIFGWSILAILAAFLINNVLNVGFGFPKVLSVFSDGGAKAFVPIAVYAIALIVAFYYVLRTPDCALRWDSDRIHRFNIYLIRVCFWAVLLVGIADATIAFMRVEKFLAIFFTEDTVRDFGRSRFVGAYIHIPLILFSFVIGWFSRTLGFTWLALLIVAAELTIVITRFVFSYEQALMGDLVRYWYAALFLFASAYTLFDEGHDCNRLQWQAGHYQFAGDEF